MKRFLLPAVAAAAVLTLGGCTKTETVNVSDANYIGFDNAYIGNPTKAVEEVTKANIDHFIVYGGYATETDLFDGTRVAPNANSEWTYSPLIPWVDEQNYKFAAYSPESLNLTAAPQFNYNEGGLTFTDVIVNNSTNQIDFVYDAADPVSSGTNVVRPKIAFAFGHMFSMIQFTIKSGFPEDVKLTISDIKFYGMNSKNTLENGVWSSSPSEALQENAPIVIAGTEEGQEVQATAEPVDYVNNCVVLPQEFGDNVIKAQFTVTAPVSASISEEVQKTITALIPADKWEAGFRYNYIVTIDGQTLDFITFDTPDVNLWQDESLNMRNDEDNVGQIIGE